jgi:sterol desaturase/sphingolipid hydroxylase (fatty acid hydroxylase superfamily)
MDEAVSYLRSCIVAALLSFAVLAVVFVPLERLFPARRQAVLRPALGTDALFFFGQYLLWNLSAIAILRGLQGLIGGSLTVRFPWPIKFALAVIAGDVLVYWFHRACHHFPLLWRFHAVHHTSEHLDWLAAHREHPVDGLLTQLAQNLPAMLVGAPTAALAGLAVFRGMWAIFIHSNVRLPLGPLKLIFGAPELHHWHHALGHGRTNYGNLAPWLDVVFGTHEEPAGESYALGIGGQRSRRGWLFAMLSPFRATTSAPEPRSPKATGRVSGSGRPAPEVAGARPALPAGL